VGVTEWHRLVLLTLVFWKNNQFGKWWILMVFLKNSLHHEVNCSADNGRGSLLFSRFDFCPLIYTKYKVPQMLLQENCLVIMVGMLYFM